MLTTLAPCLKTANSLWRFCTPIRFCWSIRPTAGSEEKVKIYNTTVGFWRGLLWNPTDGVLSAIPQMKYRNIVEPDLILFTASKTWESAS